MKLLDNYHKRLFEFARTALFAHVHPTLFADFEVGVREANSGRTQAKITVNQKLPDLPQFEKLYAVLNSKDDVNFEFLKEIHKTPSIYSLLRGKVDDKILLNILLALMPAVVLTGTSKELQKSVSISKQTLINEFQNHTLTRMKVEGASFDVNEINASTQILIVFCVSLFDSLLKQIFSEDGVPSSCDYQDATKIKKAFKNRFKYDFFLKLEETLHEKSCQISILNNSLKGTFAEIFNYRHSVVHRADDKQSPLHASDVILLFYYAGSAAIKPIALSA